MVKLGFRGVHVYTGALNSALLKVYIAATRKKLDSVLRKKKDNHNISFEN